MNKAVAHIFPRFFMLTLEARNVKKGSEVVMPDKFDLIELSVRKI